MDFLEKLDYLMSTKKLNKSSLSKACDIPYTTIDGWYKKGYEGVKLTTLRKLSSFFGTTLDYWVSDGIKADLALEFEQKKIPPPKERESLNIELVNRLTEVLIEAGFIKEGEDISENDLDFCKALYLLVRAYYGKE